MPSFRQEIKTYVTYVTFETFVKIAKYDVVVYHVIIVAISMGY